MCKAAAREQAERCKDGQERMQAASVQGGRGRGHQVEGWVGCLVHGHRPPLALLPLRHCLLAKEMAMGLSAWAERAGRVGTHTRQGNVGPGLAQAASAWHRMACQRNARQALSLQPPGHAPVASLKPCSPCMATPACPSSEYSTNAMPGFAGTMRTCSPAVREGHMWQQATLGGPAWDQHSPKQRGSRWAHAPVMVPDGFLGLSGVASRAPHPCQHPALPVPRPAPP